MMLILAAQDSDRNINKIAPDLFSAFPDMKSLSTADAENVCYYLKKIRKNRSKPKWLLELAATIKADKNYLQRKTN